jgi:RNA polymerase sigma factor (sigma-70 family)
LSALEGIDPGLGRLVELRFHAGLSVEEVARTLDTSERTVKRRWRFARAWLQQRMREDAR